LEWTSLEDGFRFILGILDQKRSKIIDFAHKYDGIWWCGHFQSGFNGGPILSPELLMKLASYEMPIYIDNYINM